MISVEQAKRIIDETVIEGNIQVLPLNQVHGFTLAEDVIAIVDIPNFVQSSMDGYAIKFADKDKPLSITGEMAAGASQQHSLKDGEAYRIFTGAPLPEGADTVVMQEKVRIENDLLTLLDNNLSAGLNVRQKGAEVKSGELAMVKETYLSAAAMGFLAGIGCTEVSIYAAPKVSIILTGNELQQPGKELSFGQVYEANSILLSAALSRVGVTDINILLSEDNAETLGSVLRQALNQSDVIILNGGVSVGDYDYVVEVAQTLGIDQRFHKVKQKPGKPFYFGTLGEKLIFGLPGNPSSGLTCFYEYVLPALEKFMRRSASVVHTMARATHPFSKPAGLTQFLKASYKDGVVTPLHAQESFRLASFAQANCFIVLPEESIGCQVNEIVEVHLLPL